MKRIAVVLLFFLCCTLFFSCSGNVRDLDALKTQEVRKLYRKATVIAKMNCTAANREKKTSELEIVQVIAGEKEGKVVLTEEFLEKGAEYLVFLIDANKNGNYNAENHVALKVDDNSVLWDKEHYDLTDVMTEMRLLGEVISINAHTFFYGKRSEMLKNCDAVVVGKVKDRHSRVQTKLRASTTGASIENTLACVKVEIDVIGSLIGDKQSNDIITMIYIPELLSSMQDATTLSTVPMSENELMLLDKDNYYIFFLIESPDVKQTYLFPVNPAQGWVKLTNDVISTSTKNELFKDCATLTDLAKELADAKD